MTAQSIGLLFVICASFGILLVLKYAGGKRIDDAKKGSIKKELSEVAKQLKSTNESGFRDMIVRLDTLLSRSLKLYYNNDEGCGENLKKANSLFGKDEYNKLWEVHKLRNKIVHENSSVNTSEARKAFQIFSSSINKIVK